MTIKSLLNKTSRKKRDTMLTWTNTQPSGANIGQAQATAPGPFTVTGANVGVSLWCATARDLSTFSGPAGSVAQEAMRTATTCYMRGLKENIKISTNSGVGWMWRRICFKLRTAAIYSTAGDTPSFPFNPYVDTSSGIGRQYFNMTINNQGTQFANFKEILFKGLEGSDWNDILIAPVDTRRVDLCYDKYRKITSGNNVGQLRDYKLWHSMNKNLAYADDESGETETTRYFSVSDKRGMGDYYVVDIIVPNPGSSVSDIMFMSSTATLYWHEK